MKGYGYLRPAPALIAVIALAATGVALEPDEKTVSPLNLVAVITDFGRADYYAGALGGAIYAANPLARVSTITHEVDAFNVAEGSYILAKSARWYPPGTVFLAEVNPGSGNKYRHIVLVTGDGKIFVGPDNGIFSGVVDELGFSRAYEITNGSLIDEKINQSHTFHSLDIYGPVSARLAGGLSPAYAGPEVDFDSLNSLEFAPPGIDGSGVTGSVVHVDRYGNLITNIPFRLIDAAGIGLSPSDDLSITAGNHTLSAKFVRTYGDVPVGDWLALIDSSGDLEIAVNMKRDAKHLMQASFSSS
jgi:hypothetical protein